MCSSPLAAQCWWTPSWCGRATPTTATSRAKYRRSVQPNSRCHRSTRNIPNASAPWRTSSRRAKDRRIMTTIVSVPFWIGLPILRFRCILPICWYKHTTCLLAITIKQKPVSSLVFIQLFNKSNVSQIVSRVAIACEHQPQLLFAYNNRYLWRCIMLAKRIRMYIEKKVFHHWQHFVHIAGVNVVETWWHRIQQTQCPPSDVVYVGVKSQEMSRDYG